MSQYYKRKIKGNYFSFNHSKDIKINRITPTPTNKYSKDKEVVYKLNFKNDGLEDIDNESLEIKALIYNQDPKDKINPLYLYKSIEKIKTFFPKIKTSLDTGNNGKIEKIIYQRLKNQEFENTLKKKINDLSLEKSFLNIKMNDLINDLHKIEYDIADNQISINTFNETNFNLTYNKINSNLDKQNKLNNNLNTFPYKIEENNKKNENQNKNQNNIKKLNNNNKEMILQRLKNRGGIKLKDLNSQLEVLKSEKSEILKKINDLEYQKEKLRIKKYSLTQELYKHYLEILKIGKDTRNEGLSWVIKEIFLLKKKVLLTYLPEFLDHLGKIFIFNQAKAKLDIDDLDKKIKLIKQELLDKGFFNDADTNKFIKNEIIDNLKDNLNKSETENSLNFNNLSKDNSENENINIKYIKVLGNKKQSIKNNNNLFLKTQFKSNKKLDNKINNINQIQQKNNILRNISITNTNYSEVNDSTANSTKYNSINKYKDKNKLLYTYNDIPDIIKLNDAEKYINKNNSISKLKNKDTVELIEEYKNLNKKLKEMKKMQEKNKKNEMDRIFNEYLRNNYYQRYNVEKNVVLSALIGEDNINNELNKQIKRAKKYFDNAKSYSLGHKRVNKKYYQFDKRNKMKLKLMIGDTFLGSIY